MGGHGAGFGDVPWGPALKVFGIRHVGCGLIAERNGVESDKGAMGYDTEEGWETMDDEYHHLSVIVRHVERESPRSGWTNLGEQDESRQDRDDDIVACNPDAGVSLPNLLFSFRRGSYH